MEDTVILLLRAAVQQRSSVTDTIYCFTSVSSVTKEQYNQKNMYFNQIGENLPYSRLSPYYFDSHFLHRCYTVYMLSDRNCEETEQEHITGMNQTGFLVTLPWSLYYFIILLLY